MGVSAFIPLGEIADALGITDAALAAGSKALDPIAPCLSDAIATGVSGVQDLLGSLTSKASNLASKILGTKRASASMRWRRVIRSVKRCSMDLRRMGKVQFGKCGGYRA
jgi:hypothetical protein